MAEPPFPTREQITELKRLKRVERVFRGPVDPRSEYEAQLREHADSLFRAAEERERLAQAMQFDRFDAGHKSSYVLNALYEGEISLAKACEWLRNYAAGSDDPIIEGVLMSGGWSDKSPRELHAERDALQAENLIFRQMLWIAHSHGLGYGDDGELQDTHKSPFIDFKRDSAELIQTKVFERNYDTKETR